MMPAGKHLDPVLGIDIHIVQPPGPVPPLPIPHPFIGIVIDPMDYAPFIGSTVNVNGLPRAQAGTSGKCIPVHIPLGGVFVKPPANECEMFMGSSTVAVDGDAFSYLALPALSCQDIGMPPIPRLKKKSTTKSLVLPTSVILPIPGPPVVVGGSPTISLMALGMKVGMAALGKGIRALQRGSGRIGRAMRAVSKRAHDAAANAMKKLGVPPNIQNKVHRAVCSVTGHPVDVATGKVFTEAVDFELPGPLPFRWERVWYSTSIYDGQLGYGWHYSYDMALLEDTERGVVALRLADGRPTTFAIPHPDHPSWNPTERLYLHKKYNVYSLEQLDGIQYQFKCLDTSGIQLHLHMVQDPNGNTIQFIRNAGRLTQIIDSAGRTLQITTDDRNRIVTIEGPHPSRSGELLTLVSYKYDQQGHLIEVGDALTNHFCYVYRRHLLTKETDRNGVSFYFEYDGSDNNARCVRTWGDGGIYERRLEYDLMNQCTTVGNSFDYKTIYYWNDLGLVVREIDPLSGEKLTEWDEHANKLAETNACGETTCYDYDVQGKVRAIIDPLGNRRKIVYDTIGNVIALSNEDGSTWRREYDSRRNVVAAIDPMGSRWAYQVDHRGLPLKEIDPLGQETRFEWNLEGNLTLIEDRTNAKVALQYNELGQLVKRKDAVGAQTEIIRDLLNRVTEIRTHSGRVLRYRYDGMGNLLEAIDSIGRKRSFSYNSRGLPTRIQNPSGGITHYIYDKEGALVRARDPRAREWIFDRDAVGNVTSEYTFDGRQLRYEYDAVGRINASTNSRGRRTEYKRDVTGRLLFRCYSDGTEEAFEYDSRGLLIRAVNSAAVVSLKYDSVGRIVAEGINNKIVENRYDSLGNRITRISPYGRKLDIAYDGEGRLVSVSDAQALLTSLTYDPLGREIRRTLPGMAISERRYTSNGEISLSHTVRHGTTLLSKEYRYDKEGQVTEIRSASFGATKFEHDLDGRLIATTYPDGTDHRYLYDVAGNAHGIPSMSLNSVDQSKYSRTGNWEIHYDSDGYITEKRNNDLSYKYDYDSVGRLARVTKNGNATNEFAYDALGRRIKKTSDVGTTEYFWDGDVLLGEEIFDKNKKVKTREYLFYPTSFEPIAVLESKDILLFECDGNGTPWAAINRKGEVVWEAMHESFGKIIKERGLTAEIPIRFAGQLADSETGLHYNRFRYYDPDLRIYICPDPIGLSGGINNWNYVRSPMKWVDPYGLSGSIPGRGTVTETFGKVVKPENAVDEWDNFLGPGPHTNTHPRTGLPDPDRIVSADGTRSIRYGDHEMNSSPTKHHYHEEIWTHDPNKNVMDVDNTIRRVPNQKPKKICT